MRFYKSNIYIYLRKDQFNFMFAKGEKIWVRNWVRYSLDNRQNLLVMTINNVNQTPILHYKMTNVTDESYWLTMFKPSHLVPMQTNTKEWTIFNCSNPQSISSLGLRIWDKYCGKEQMWKVLFDWWAVFFHMNTKLSVFFYPQIETQNNGIYTFWTIESANS